MLFPERLASSTPGLVWVLGREEEKIRAHLHVLFVTQQHVSRVLWAFPRANVCRAARAILGPRSKDSTTSIKTLCLEFRDRFFQDRMNDGTLSTVSRTKKTVKIELI